MYYYYFFSSDFEVGAIRIQVAGDWQVQQFASLLEDIRFIHNKLFFVAAIGSLVGPAARKGKFRTTKPAQRYRPFLVRPVFRACGLLRTTVGPTVRGNRVNSGDV